MSSVSCKQNFSLISNAFKSYHHPTLHTATSFAWSSPLSPEVTRWKSPTSILVPSSLFTTQQLLFFLKMCIRSLHSLAQTLQWLPNTQILLCLTMAYKAQQWTGPVTSLASSPTTPALKAFFLFLKHANVKQANLFLLRAFALVYSAWNALPPDNWMAHYMFHMMLKCHLLKQAL